MKGLFWNCRGFRKNGMSPYARDLIRDGNFDFLCFQETIMHDFFTPVLDKWILGDITRGIGCLL
jgi:hypothetical protein